MKKNIINCALLLFVLCVIAYSIKTLRTEFSSAFENTKTNEVTAPIYDHIVINNTPSNYNTEFELPINGASGYASIYIELKIEPNEESVTLKDIKPGEGFTIIEEKGNWWKVNYNNIIGYVLHKNCFINLPDILPSIIYNITNSDKSIMKSSKKDIENITGNKLYNVLYYNERLEKKEYAVPVLYSMAKKIALAQKTALSNNETLIIYEAFRPYETQKNIVNNLNNLASIDEEVYNGIHTSPWEMTWFVSTHISNHQRGLAIDVSLGKINQIEEKEINSYLYKQITDYEEYKMPSAMHELSIRSIRYTTPVSSKSKTAWQNAKYSYAMQNSDEARKLERYCTNAGLTPLASEWWHFNDLDSVSDENGTGRFTIKNIYSIKPE